MSASSVAVSAAASSSAPVPAPAPGLAPGGSSGVGVRHAIPGRIRFRLAALKRGARGARTGVALDRLRNLRGVVFVRVNARCASMVVRYDPHALDRAEVEAEVLRLFGTGGNQGAVLAARPAGKGACPGPRACPCPADDGKAVRSALRRFVAISAVAAAALARRAVTGAALAQGPLSPLGLAALAFGLPLLGKGVRNLKEKRFSQDIFLGAGAVAAVAAGEALTAFEILWINSGAELLTSWIGERSRRSVAEMLEITSHHTFVLAGGVEVERAVDDLVPGDMVVLHTGEKVCVDGIIEEGEALFDEAPITGRAELAHKGPGQEVFAGTFVRQGVVYVRADRVGDCTYLARIMRKVQDSLESRAPIEGVADRLAATLVRVGGAATLGTFLLTGSAWRAFTVLLVMACPCATALAASTAVSASLSAAARRHILIKGGRYLEEIGSCDTVCFDKTGTLTTSEPALALAAPAEGVDGATLLRLAVSAEAHNHHPLAQALKAEAARLGIEPLAHSVCHYELGMGMRAEVGGEEIVVGNAKLARLFGLNVAELEEAARGPRERGMTVLYAFRAGAPLGVLAFESREREGAREVVRRLRGLGVRRFMLVTGDEQATARDMARRLDIDEVHASVLPGDKARIVEAAMARGHKVLMVGDGINDALALARVDVGVAVGTGGSEVAVEAADIALVADDLEGLADVYGLSRRTLAVVRQNFWIATGSNVAGVALGALGLLSPVAAGLLHVGHSLGVLANSSRLLGFAAGGQGDAERSTGGDHGFSRAGGAAQVSEREAPPAGQDQDQVRRGHHPGPGGAAPGAVQR